MGNSRPSKRYCTQFFITVFALFGTLLLFVFIFDPWQLFHQPWFRKPVFINNARFQNAGIINSYSFDSAILGNSMAENFSAEEASALLGGKFVNLSMAGSMFSERHIVLQHLFRKKNVKKIIISMDHLPYDGVGQYNKDMPPEQFAFLYNNNPFDDLRIYFDVNLFQCWDVNNSCRKKLPGSRKNNLTELYPWYPYYKKAFGGTQAWCRWSSKSAPFKAFLQLTVNVTDEIEKGHEINWPKKLMKNYQINASGTFNTYIRPVVEKNPHTQFLLFFPPYSRLWYSMQEQYYTDYYQSYLLFLEYVVHAVSNYTNAQVFGFDNMPFTADIANYKDQSHYHKDINSRLLHLMAEPSNVLTEENIEEYLTEISELAHNYDLKSTTDAFKRCLKQ